MARYSGHLTFIQYQQLLDRPCLPLHSPPVPLGHSADFNFTSSFCSVACALGTQKPEFQVERENHLISWTLLAYESSSKMMERKEGWEDIREWLNRRQSVPTTKLTSQVRFFTNIFGQIMFFFQICLGIMLFIRVYFWEAYELQMDRDCCIKVSIWKHVQEMLELDPSILKVCADKQNVPIRNKL